MRESKVLTDFYLKERKMQRAPLIKILESKGVNI